MFNAFIFVNGGGVPITVENKLPVAKAIEDADDYIKHLSTNLPKNASIKKKLVNCREDNGELFAKAFDDKSVYSPAMWTYDAIKVMQKTP